MIVTVRLFARAKELAGGDLLRVELPDGARVADLRRQVVEMKPSLASLLPRCAIAVDAEFVGDEQPLSEGAEIALLPPVSGG